MAKTPRARNALGLLRRLALALPEVSETVTFGHPTFRAGKKTFAVVERYQGEDVLTFKASLADQALFILDPRFFVAPYVGRHGWTSMRLDEELEPEEAFELLRSSYRLVATRRMLGALDGAAAKPVRPKKSPKKSKKTKKK